MEFPGLYNHLEANFLPCDGEVLYSQNFIEEDYLEELINDIQWGQSNIQIFGKTIPEPRLTAWYADPEINYTYSGATKTPIPWNLTLLDLKKKVEIASGISFNGVLLNYYRSGTDYMGWHSDDEKELGDNPIIASLSFGEARRFQLKHKTKKELETKTIETKSGSLIIMKGETQKHWKHRLAKTEKKVGERINLTFRKIV